MTPTTAVRWRWPRDPRYAGQQCRQASLRDERLGALNIQPHGGLLVEYVCLFEGMTKSTLSELAHMLASTSDEISLELGSRFFGGNLVE